MLFRSAGLEDGWKPVAAKLDGFNAKIAATFTGWQAAASAATGGAEWAALPADAMPGGWNPVSTALTQGGAKGAYGQNLVWDEQNKAWTYPWATGGAFGARKADGSLDFQPIVFNVGTINASTPADAELAAGDLVYALGSKGLAI